VDIAAWLRELGLERYAQAFRENEIDAEILPKLRRPRLVTRSRADAKFERQIRPRRCARCGRHGRWSQASRG
jgi:hypothetical protein